jgi:hypothetical protein
MRRVVTAAALMQAFALLLTGSALAQLLQPQLSRDLAAQQAGVPQPTNLRVIDRPGDDGSGLVVLFDIEAPADQVIYIVPQVLVDGAWHATEESPLPLDGIQTVGEMPQLFGLWPRDEDSRVVVITGYRGAPVPAEAEAPGAADETAQTTADPAPKEEEEAPMSALEPGKSYDVQLSVIGAQGQVNVPTGTGVPRQNLFAPNKLNVLLITLIFAGIILGAVFKARAHPGRLFIRRIAGLEAVEEAIGRATEMGKPVMQINGLDPLTTPSTIAAVNILGQIARKVAHYDSRLMVPSFDPVVMTVSQETVKQAYLVEGRPDAYREEDIFFVTDQQFSYVASVCGLMLRERPAANFFLGYFYAESLLLAETGQSTGAIQIAGTDAQAQLPFFITTCDYTLIGEELYAASAYLSREPLLLGNLKGLDVSKVIIMLLILAGSLLATFGVPFLTELFTPLS